MHIEDIIKHRNKGVTWMAMSRMCKGALTPNALRKAYYRHIDKPNVKILILDIETKPLLGWVWGLWDNNVALNQLEQDWSILSWSAKWLHDPDDKVMYNDNRKAKNLDDDRELLQEVWELLDQADIVITHFGEKFDIPKLFTRFAYHDMNKPSSFRQIDTKKIASTVFSFTSNKLEYLAKFLKVKHKKLTDRKFVGQDLWTGCIKGVKAAWDEMKLYNERDVIVLQEVYHRLKKWDKKINFDVYHNELINICPCCEGKSFTIHKHKPFIHTNTGKFDRLICVNPKCGHELKGKINHLSKEKRKSLKG
jgi:RNase_H superfamily